jgi:hypothetical protein
MPPGSVKPVILTNFTRKSTPSHREIMSTVFSMLSGCSTLCEQCTGFRRILIVGSTKMYCFYSFAVALLNQCRSYPGRNQSDYIDYILGNILKPLVVLKPLNPTAPGVYQIELIIKFKLDEAF